MRQNHYILQVDISDRQSYCQAWTNCDSKARFFFQTYVTEFSIIELRSFNIKYKLRQGSNVKEVCCNIIDAVLLHPGSNINKIIGSPSPHKIPNQPNMATPHSVMKGGEEKALNTKTPSLVSAQGIETEVGGTVASLDDMQPIGGNANVTAREIQLNSEGYIDNHDEQQIEYEEFSSHLLSSPQFLGGGGNGSRTRTSRGGMRYHRGTSTDSGNRIGVGRTNGTSICNNDGPQLPSTLPSVSTNAKHQQYTTSTGALSSKATSRKAVLPSTLPHQNLPIGAPPQLSQDVRQIVAARPNYTSLPNFDKVVLVDGTKEYVHYKPHNQTISVQVPARELREILNISFDTEGFISLVNTHVIKGGKPSQLFHKHFGRHNLTKPFQPSVKRSPVMFEKNITINPSASQPPKGRKSPKHGLAFGYSGKCVHHVAPCNCQSKFMAGFEEVELFKLKTCADDHPLIMKCTLIGTCTHYAGVNRSRVFGDERRQKVKAIKSGCDRMKGPTQIAKEGLDSLSDVDFATNCTDGVPVSVQQAKNLKRDAKQEELEDKSLGRDMLENMITANKNICEQDMSQRAKLKWKGDMIPQVCQGVMHAHPFNKQFQMILFRYRSILLLAAAASTGHAFLHIDATGNLLKRPVDKILHSKLAFSPACVFNDTDDNAHTDKLYASMVVAEFVSPNQSGDALLGFFQAIDDACRQVTGGRKDVTTGKVIGGQSSCPRGIWTDCDGASINGAIRAYRNDEQVTNRVMYHNVLLKALLHSSICRLLFLLFWCVRFICCARHTPLLR